MEEMRNAYKNIVGKPEAKRPPGGPMHRWEDNIKVNLILLDLRLWTGFS
jgi:hypothetical protein